MKILVHLAVLSVTLCANAQNRRSEISERGTVLFASKSNDVVSLAAAPTNTMHWFRLTKFTIEPLTNDSPSRFVLSGRVNDRNAGAAAEQIPIFFASPLHPARLAAVSDAQGNFSFHVCLKEDTRDCWLQTASITNSEVFVGAGSIYYEDQFDHGRNLVSGLVRKYSVSELVRERKINLP